VSGYGAFGTVPPATFPHTPNPTYAQSEVRAACAPDRRRPVVGLGASLDAEGAHMSPNAP